MAVLKFVPLLLLLCAALAFFWLADRRLFRGLLVRCCSAAAQLCGVGCYVWLLLSCDSWWSYSLWLLGMGAVIGVVTVRRARLPWRRALPVAAAVVLTIVMVCAVLMLVLPVRLLLPVAALLAAGLYESMGFSLTAYMRSYGNTQAHRYYLLANGATLLESLMPSIRRALRVSVVPQLKRFALPVIITGTTLFWGMLMGGMAVKEALVATLLIWAAAFTATVMATLTAIYFLTISDK